MAKKKAARKKTSKKEEADIPVIPDYADLAGEEPELPEELLKRITTVVKRQLDLEAAQKQAEELLKEVKTALERVRDKMLPDLLEEGGVTSLTLANGATVEVTTAIRASLGRSKNPEKADKAIKWLVKNGYAHLVSHDFTIPLTAGQGELSDALKKKLGKLSEELSKENEEWSIDFVDKEDVNAKRLSSWVDKSLKEGIEIPEDLFNVFRQRAAKIKVT